MSNFPIFTPIPTYIPYSDEGKEIALRALQRIADGVPEPMAIAKEALLDIQKSEEYSTLQLVIVWSALSIAAILFFGTIGFIIWDVYGKR